MYNVELLITCSHVMIKQITYIIYPLYCPYNKHSYKSSNWIFQSWTRRVLPTQTARAVFVTRMSPCARQVDYFSTRTTLLIKWILSLACYFFLLKMKCIWWIHNENVQALYYILMNMKWCISVNTVSNHFQQEITFEIILIHLYKTEYNAYKR